ncbi:uncharacterized protein M6B38_191735 [Iris pallida]|uniref:Uncharacterized protein n=1 Tax=Iris pallida TaxID=29817 RepID=A0AAX6EFB3_IRIPA|nr:uncharacterized protein M6B38_191735 [Iris pallida]
MAAARSHHQVLKQTFRLFTPRGVEGLSSRGPSEEFEESDVWNCQPEPGKSASRPHGAKEKPAASPSCVSVPVNVPDWQKILLHEYKSSYSSCYKNRFDEEEEEEEEEDVRRLPPHQIVIERRAASPSVVEGVGRTLKGRDLSRVRNAIWAQTGFQD